MSSNNPPVYKSSNENLGMTSKGPASGGRFSSAQASGHVNPGSVWSHVQSDRMSGGHSQTSSGHSSHASQGGGKGKK